MAEDFSNDKNKPASKLSELNQALYSRTKYQNPNMNRSTVEPLDLPALEADWKTKSIDDIIKSDNRKPPTHPIMKKLFIIAVVFFVLTLGFTAYVFLGGSNFISSKNVDITILGPVSVSAGEILNMNVNIKNNNNADLTNTNLLIEYPDSTRSPDDANTTLVRSKIPIGTIASGGEYNYIAKAIILGQKTDTKEIKVSIDYGVKGSNATFTKEKLYDVSIGTSPVTMTVEEPESVVSGDNFTTTVTIVSNSSEILKNVLLKGEYPYGYSMKDSIPRAVRSENIWVIGDMAPGDKKIVKITGILSGEDKEERTFRFYTGIASTNDSQKFDATLALQSNTISINHSSLGMKMFLNGDEASTIVAPIGRIVEGRIDYVNNLPQSVINGRIQLKLSGASLDKYSVVAQNGGFYNSAQNTITWDKTGTNDLGVLTPGATGQVSFRFSSLTTLSTGNKNSEISLNTNFVAVPQNNDNTINAVANDSGSVKIASEVSLTAKALYSRGPFTNSGLTPPKVEKPTTYTVSIILGNTQNDITDSVVMGTLGTNVTWTGEISPNGENVIYDETTNTFKWNVGTLPSGAGFSTAGKQIFFKVSLTPSIGQINTAPILVQNISFNGTDSFTKEVVKVNAPQVTTRTDTDPKYVQGNDMVVK
ncbi:MAG: hypothetical protein WAV25_00900 [Minisyncoccia bacterium]